MPSIEQDDLITSSHWQSPRSHVFAHAAHINIREILACVAEVERRGKQGERDKRLVPVLISRVAVGAIAKGPSSPRTVNRALTQLRVLYLRYGLAVRPVWVS